MFEGSIYFHTLTNIYFTFVLKIANIVSVGWYLLLLISKDAEHLLMCLLVICILLWIYTFSILCSFESCVVCFLLSILYVFWTLDPYQI